MDDDPAPAGPPLLPRAGTAQPPRRGFLIGSGVAVAAAASGGIALGMTARTGGRVAAHAPGSPDPTELIAAAAAEQALIAQLDAAASQPHGRQAAVVRAIRRNHAAHLAAIRAALAEADPGATMRASPAASSTLSGSVPGAAGQPSGTAAPPPTRAQLRAAEARAARAAATRALALTGRDAVLLASIAACEAAHAQVLS